MNNDLSDLNKFLFEQLERLSAKGMNEQQIEMEVTRTSAIVNISEKIIDNAKVHLDAAELVAKHGVGRWEDMLPNVSGKPTPPDYTKLGSK